MRIRRYCVRWVAILACAALSGACATPSPPEPGAAREPAGQQDTEVAEPDGPALPPLHPAIDDLDETVVTIVSADGDEVEVDAKVAATDAERRRGLMEVTRLPSGTGMLFLFDDARRGGFWMWNTLIALDIAFVADDGTVHTVATMVPCEADDPAACPTTGPDAPYVAALEVPGGWFDEVGVAPGARMSWTDPATTG